MPTTYHPALVVLHWLAAILIAGALIAGSRLADLPDTDPGRLMALRLHMAGGVAILFVMLVRLAVRLRTPHPPKSPTGIVVFDLLAPVVHWGLYAALIGMALSGIALSVASGLGAAVWGGGALPADLGAYALRQVHGLLSWAVLGLIGVHVLGALLHGAIAGDGVMSRMWFGGR